MSGVRLPSRPTPDHAYTEATTWATAARTAAWWNAADGGSDSTTGACVIIDEFGSVLIDEACLPLVLSDNPQPWSGLAAT